VTAWYASRGALALLLVLSVGIKLTHGYSTPLSQAASVTKSEVAAFLDRQGFRVDEVDATNVDSPFVQAAKGTCHLLAVAAAPQGWHRDLVHRLAAPDDQVFFVVDGTVFDDQPQWRTWTYHYWRLVNRFVGRRLPLHPVLGVVASPDCDLGNLPWRDVARLP
jgi:hypothetical protein